MEVKSISQKIFGTPKSIDNNSNHTNPFGVSFKGNIISADVFESSEKSNVAFKGAELAAKVGSNLDKMSKLVSSTVVGSIGDMTSAIKTRLNSVVDFGKRIKDTTITAWNYLNTTKLSVTFGAEDTLLGMKIRLTRGDAYEPQNLNGLSLVEKTSLFENAIKAKMGVNDEMVGATT